MCPLDSRSYFPEIINAHLGKGNQCWITNSWLPKWVGSHQLILPHHGSVHPNDRVIRHTITVLKSWSTMYFSLTKQIPYKLVLFPPLMLDAKNKSIPEQSSVHTLREKSGLLMFSFVTILDSQASLFKHSFQKSINYNYSNKVSSPEEHWNTNSELLLNICGFYSVFWIQES